MHDDAATTVARREAAAWFVANRDPREAAARADEFLAWLRASPANVREYLAAAELAREFATVPSTESVDEIVAQALADEPSSVVRLKIASVATRHASPPAALPSAPESAPQPASQPASTRAAPRRRAAYALAASLLVAAIGLFALRPDWLHATGSADAIYRTAHGEQRTFTLADGSVIHLNSESEVSLHFDARARNVELRSGQALFDVAKDPSRPFEVHAGSTAVRAVGTQFEVYRREDATLVTVVEGKVAVTTDRVAGAGPRAPSVALVAGQRLRVPVPALEAVTVPQVVLPEHVDARATVAWSHRQFVFDSMPLGEVVAELNRYSAQRIVVDDELASRPISGVFDVYDSASFLEFLRRIDRVSVTPRDGAVHVALDVTNGGTR
jgi:transmembrane sensor